MEGPGGGNVEYHIGQGTQRVQLESSDAVSRESTIWPQSLLMCSLKGLGPAGNLNTPSTVLS